MSEIISSLITPQVKAVFVIIIIFIVALYLLSIIWVVRDSYLRGASPLVWGIVAVIPFAGCMAYAMLRPPLYQADQEEQNIGLLLQQRELMAYGECPQCGYPTERAYIVCPNCHVRLKNNCATCGKPLEPEWSVCPYCASKAGRAAAPRREGAPRTKAVSASQAQQQQQRLQASSRPSSATPRPSTRPATASGHAAPISNRTAATSPAHTMSSQRPRTGLDNAPRI